MNLSVVAMVASCLMASVVISNNDDDVEGVADSKLVNPDDGEPLEFDPLDYENDMILIGDENERNAMRNPKAKWPGGVIPYKIRGLGSRESRALQQAIADYNKYTCISWEPYDTSKHGRYADYVEFFRGAGCYSYVGRSRDRYRQPISLGTGCGVKGIAIHEMMHTIGFFHEQSRADRDKYVKINFGKYHDQFEKLTASRENNLGAKYDYNSIMHYGRKAFAYRRDRDTVVPLLGNAEIGQRKGFSDVDIWKINKLYACPEYNAYVPITSTPSPPDTTLPPTTVETTPQAESDPETAAEVKNIKIPTVAPEPQPKITVKPAAAKTPKPPLITTKPPEAEVCKDRRTYPIRYCRHKSFWGHCRRSETVRMDCRKTCKLCTETSKPVVKEEECVDKMTTCKLGYNCQLYGETQCRKSCGKCTPNTQSQAQEKKKKKSGWWG